MQCLILVNLFYISVVMVSLPLFVCFVCLYVCNDHMMCMLYRSRW